jgi:glycosyltransferase involved in cell wall biosynthesis
MVDPKFTVIIPAFNSQTTIGDCLRSVYGQTCRSFEVIVVDDGSVDDTQKIVRDFPDVRLVSQQNRGPGAARNLGASLARGQWLAFLDSDDLWYPWTLENYHHALRDCGARFGCGAGVEFAGVEVPEVRDSSMSSTAYQDYLQAGCIGVWLGTCGVVIHVDAFAASGGFVARNINAEDSDLWLRLGTVSPFVFIDSPPSFAYRRTSSSATGNLGKSIAGMLHLLESEHSGCYPGGLPRRADRDAIIGRHVRPVCLEALKQRKIISAWRVFFKSLRIQLRTRRFRFLFAFPVLSVKSVLRVCFP